MPGGTAATRMASVSTCGRCDPPGDGRRILSWAGWCHVVYVAFEIAVLTTYVVTPVPVGVVVLVSLLLCAHVPLGVLVPAWSATGRVFREDVWQTAGAIAAVWIVAAVKVLGT